MTPKRCVKCGEEYPATPEYFHRCAAKKSGLSTACKACRVAEVRTYRARSLPPGGKRPRKERDPSTYRRGEAHHLTKLTEQDARLVLALLGEGLSERQVAEKFEVSRGCICAIRQCRSWTYL